MIVSTKTARVLVQQNLPSLTKILSGDVRPSSSIRHLCARTSVMSDAGKFAIRKATSADLKFPTHLAITNDWRMGPNDFKCAYDFDSSGFLVGEVDGKIVSSIVTITYPGHSLFIGSFMVLEEHRGKGYGKLTVDFAWNSLDHSYNIGAEGILHMIPLYESKFGFRTVWETPIAFLNFEKIIKNIGNIKSGISVFPIKTVDKEKLYQYDSSVFGAPRDVMIEKWINIPGSLGWAAVDGEGNIVGYNVARPTIIDKGSEFGLSMGPFFADNKQIAEALLKTAAEECLANEAIPVCNFEMLYPLGGESGAQAAELVMQVKGTSIPFCKRMYTKGVPRGRQVDKVYGILQAAFD